MSTVRKETEPEDKQEAPREKGGVSQEDRSKSMGGQPGPFEGQESNPKRKE